MRTVRPWAVTAAGIAAVVCFVGWPWWTLRVLGAVAAAAVLVLGVRLLLAEQRRPVPGAVTVTYPSWRRPAPAAVACAGCAGCGGPDCAERSGPDPEATWTDPHRTAPLAADQPGPDPDALRTRIATTIWERQNPGRNYADCQPPWNADAESDADAVLVELAPELAELVDYRNRLTWETTCGEHAQLLDSCRDADERADRAEAALTRVRQARERIAHAAPPIDGIWALDELDAALNDTAAEGSTR